MIQLVVSLGLVLVLSLVGRAPLHWRARALLAGVLLVATYAAPTSAQLPVHAVSGVVFDSVAGAPLPGAIVQVVQLDSASRFTAKRWWGVSDTHGRFRIAGLPTGRYAFGFQHDALVALRLESPLRIVEVFGASGVVVDLAIPRAAVGGGQRCVAGDANARGSMLTGVVLDAVTAAPLDSVALDLGWIEVERTAVGYRTVPRRVTTLVGRDGKYSACGLPASSPVNVRVARNGYRDVSGEITIPAGGASRRDFHLANAHMNRGTASLAGRVVRVDSVPVSGHFLIPALRVDVAIADGHFILSGLPAGTWMAETRAIGYEPQSAMIDLVAQTTTSATIVLGPKVQPLEPVTVLGRPTMEMRKLAEILERKRVGFGTWFLPGDDRWARAEFLRDLASISAGFRIDRNGAIEGRVIGGLRGLARCHPTIYIDDVRSDTQWVPPMKDILAVGMYPDLMGVPVQWRDLRTCAAIGIWTKR